MAESPIEAPSLAPAKLVPLIITLALGVILWFVPPPEGVKQEAWHLLAIFVATIVGIIAKPLPMGAVAGVGGAVSVINIVIWLSVGALWWNIIGLM